MNAPFELLGPIARARALKREYLMWLQKAVHAQTDTTRYCAVTLTLKQGVVRPGALELLDRDKTSKCLQYSLGQLNAEVYKNAYKRYDKKLLCFPSIERGKVSERWHIHMILQVPNYLQDQEFFDLFSQVWQRNEWSRKKFDIVSLPGRDVEHWTKYCLKDVVMNDETINVQNLHLPS